MSLVVSCDPTQIVGINGQWQAVNAFYFFSIIQQCKFWPLLTLVWTREWNWRSHFPNGVNWVGHRWKENVWPHGLWCYPVGLFLLFVIAVIVSPLAILPWMWLISSDLGSQAGLVSIWMGDKAKTFMLGSRTLLSCWEQTREKDFGFMTCMELSWRPRLN